MQNDFAVFILTHGRAKQQKTLSTLLKCGYTGPLFLVIDDEDDQGPLYKKLYGDRVLTFSKQHVEKHFDTMTNQKEYRSVVYARNASYALALERGIRFIFMCDDDISNLSFRVVRDGKLKGFNIQNINRLFEAMTEYMRSANLGILGFSQAGAFIGGANSKKYQEGCQRNCAQAMMFDAHHPILFRGIFNEDLQVALDAGTAGKVVLSTMLVSITSPERTTNTGGLHDLYKANSTYTPCFYTLMAYPGVARIENNGPDFRLRLSHNAFAPLILSDKHRKRDADA